jgi:hypothetical protein
MLAKLARSLHEVVSQSDEGDKVKCLQYLSRVSDITSASHMRPTGHELKFSGFVNSHYVALIE